MSASLLKIVLPDAGGAPTLTVEIDRDELFNNIDWARGEILLHAAGQALETALIEGIYGPVAWHADRGRRP